MLLRSVVANIFLQPQPMLLNLVDTANLMKKERIHPGTLVFVCSLYAIPFMSRIDILASQAS